MNRASIRLYGCLLLLVLSLVSAGLASPQYHSTLISGTAYGHSAPYVNDAGQVVGNDHIVWLGDRAFIWENGVKTQFAPISGADYSKVSAINDLGVVVGSSGDYAVTWKDGAPEIITNLNFRAECMGINNSGDLVISGYPGPGVNRDIYLFHDGTRTNLDVDTPVITWSSVFINDSGQLAGYGWDNLIEGYPGDPYAYFWTEALGRTRLPFDIVTGLNDLGQVVGRDRDGVSYIWQDNQATVLAGFEATGINNNGLMVGSSDYRAAIRENGQVFDLNSITTGDHGDAVLGYCYALSDTGYIVASTSDSYYLLTPVPEPASAAVLLTGLCTLALARRRRQG